MSGGLNTGSGGGGHHHQDQNKSQQCSEDTPQLTTFAGTTNNNNYPSSFIPSIPSNGLTSDLKLLNKVYNLDQFRAEIEQKITATFLSAAQNKAIFLLRM